MKTFDLIVIGGGAGAFAAAIRANELKAKTAIVNAGLPMGGTCVNVGCVPSKTLLYAGEVLHHAKRHGVRGVEKVVRDELSLVEKLRREKYEKVLKRLEYATAGVHILAPNAGELISEAMMLVKKTKTRLTT